MQVLYKNNFHQEQLSSSSSIKIEPLCEIRISNESMPPERAICKEIIISSVSKDEAIFECREEEIHVNSETPSLNYSHTSNELIKSSKSTQSTTTSVTGNNSPACAISRASSPEVVVIKEESSDYFICSCDQCPSSSLTNTLFPFPGNPYMAQVCFMPLFIGKNVLQILL